MLGFIGVGAMGGAIVEGLLRVGYNQNQFIFLYDFNPQKLQLFNKKNIVITTSAQEVLNRCDTIIIAVKPHDVGPLLKDLAPLLAGKCVVSLAAGLSLTQLANFDAKLADIAFIRLMPNLNAGVGGSVTAICKNNQVTEAQFDKVIKLIEKVGSVHLIPEDKFGVFTGIAGSAPAFVYLFMDSLARAALKNGLPKDLALQIVANMTAGSAKMALEQLEVDGLQPWPLIDKVCSPGGTTIAGITKLEELGFAYAAIAAVEAVISREQLITKN
ncbi:MAG: pyrroline-5-carboxylate reductase [Spirochaetaceae bacterium]|nr:pyrroline-5-carboxylate reductase [Spirochaetaceae bacterium]